MLVPIFHYPIVKGLALPTTERHSSALSVTIGYVCHKTLVVPTSERHNSAFSVPIGYTCHKALHNINSRAGFDDVMGNTYDIKHEI